MTTDPASDPFLDKLLHTHGSGALLDRVYYATIMFGEIIIESARAQGIELGAGADEQSKIDEILGHILLDAVTFGAMLGMAPSDGEDDQRLRQAAIAIFGAWMGINSVERCERMVALTAFIARGKNDSGDAEHIAEHLGDLRRWHSVLLKSAMFADDEAGS